MKNWLQIVNALLLAALIALTSVSMSLARGQMRDAAGSMVLCTGAGPVSVQIDRDGQPIGPIHICPDCAFSFMDHVAIDGPFMAPVLTRYTADFDDQKTVWSGHYLIWIRARGPPLL